MNSMVITECQGEVIIFCVKLQKKKKKKLFFLEERPNNFGVRKAMPFGCTQPLLARLLAPAWFKIGKDAGDQSSA